MAIYEDFDVLHIAQSAGVIHLTIANPPLNVLDVKLMTELHRFAVLAAADRETRVIVIQSADPDIFVAHGDMNFVTNPESFMQLSALEDNESPLNPMQRLHERFRTLPQVTIGKLNGFARCGGNEFAMSLDMRFAAKGRTGLAQTEVLMGILPGGGGTQYLTRLIGRSRALEAILGAGLFDAETAETYGWINRALPAHELASFVDSLAERIAGLPSEIIAAVKEAVPTTDKSLQIGLEQENLLLGQLFSKPETAEKFRSALKAGAQTRAGEMRFEEIFNSL